MRRKLVEFLVPGMVHDAKYYKGIIADLEQKYYAMRDRAEVAEAQLRGIKFDEEQKAKAAAERAAKKAKKKAESATTSAITEEKSEPDSGST